MSNIKERIDAQNFIKDLTGRTKFIISRNSSKMGLSRQTYQNKVDNLRNQKIITNFTININPNISPNNLKFVMLEIKTNPKEPKLVEELLKIPQLRMLDGIFGEFSLFALFIFKSSEEYYQILNTIDNIMAKSYFKKYQIIETIKVFKINGISLRNINMTYEEELVEKSNYRLKKIKVYDPNSDYKIENSGIVPMENIDVNQISRNYLKNFNLNLNIDNIDYEILQILRDRQGDKPISTYEIKKIFKKQLNNEISQSTIYNRIKKLEQQGIILNYTVNFSPKELGFKGKYILRIKPKDPSKYNDLAFKLENNINITDLFRIGEQYGLLAIVRVRKIEDYGNFIRNLYLTEEIEDTFTHFVLDELKTYTNFLIF